jgi:hypothetical protein
MRGEIASVRVNPTEDILSMITKKTRIDNDPGFFIFSLMTLM